MGVVVTGPDDKGSLDNGETLWYWQAWGGTYGVLTKTMGEGPPGNG